MLTILQGLSQMWCRTAIRNAAAGVLDEQLKHPTLECDDRSQHKPHYSTRYTDMQPVRQGWCPGR